MEKINISYFLSNLKHKDKPIVMINAMYGNHGTVMPMCECPTVELAEKMVKNLEEARDRAINRDIILQEAFQ